MEQSAQQSWPSQRFWRVIDLIKWGEEYLRERGFESPRREIEWLLRDLLQCSRLDLYLRFEEPLEPRQLTVLRGWIRRRLRREPLQYITGKAEFYGLTLRVNPAVLIPRPETERVVDVALHAVGNQGRSRILDMGTGSGNIALAIAHELPRAEVLGVDVDPAALEVARENAQRLKMTNVRFEQVDFLTQRIPEIFDLVVCNPPYIARDEMKTLMDDVAVYEPHLALTDQADGCTFYRRFREVAPELIRPGGYLVLEVGLGTHPRRAAAFFNAPPFQGAELIADYNGDERVLKVQLAERE
jgi:release factor glutamine methyltransferase